MRHGTRRAGALRRWIEERLSVVVHVPGVAAGTTLLAAAALLWLAPGETTVTAVELTTDATPLTVAGGPSTPVVGYVGVGQQRVYVTALTLVVLLVGEATAARGTAGSYALAALCGVVGAGSLVALSGCGCGTGSAAFLLDAALGGA